MEEPKTINPYNIAGYDFPRQYLEFISPNKIKARYKGYHVFIAQDKKINFWTYKILINSSKGEILLKETIKETTSHNALTYAFQKLGLKPDH